jgi:ADP-ribose pyrophosphatase YjhB (NUDIX family)
LALVRKTAMRAFRVLPTPRRRLAVSLGTPSYTLGAVLVLRRADGRILLVDQRHSGGWALPGGLLRRHESPVDGLVREVGEEIGVHLDPAALPEPKVVVEARAHRVDLIYVVDAEGQRPHVEDEAEVRGIGWFSLEEMDEITDPTREILEAVARP